MIIADTLNKRIVFDIGPGDIGPGQRLVLSFLSGLTISLIAQPLPAKNEGISQIVSGTARYFSVFDQKGQTA